MVGNSQLIEHYRQAHASRVYGTSSVKYLRYLRPEIGILRPRSVLDYGCGQSRFVDMLEIGYPLEVLRYDPAIPQYATPPAQPADLLINIDVLEHIEEHDLDAVLAHMRSLCRHAIIIVDTKASNHMLADGRNAHVSLHPHAWWQARIEKHFGPVRRIATPRSSRAGFATWQLAPRQRLARLVARARETGAYCARRAVGRHKTAWKDSTTHNVD